MLPAVLVLGRTCAGKSTCCAHLRSIGDGWVVISASEIMRALTRDRGRFDRLPAARSLKVMRDLGPDIVARRIESQFPDGRNVIVDGLRSPAEVGHLRSAWPSVRVLNVVAPTVTRYRRSVVRARDPQLLDWATWLEEDQLQAAMGLTDEVLGSMSDITIHNDASLKRLHGQLKDVAALWTP